jgi:hypothetical protein
MLRFGTSALLSFPLADLATSADSGVLGITECASMVTMLRTLCSMATDDGAAAAREKEASVMLANRAYQQKKATMSFRDDRDLEGQIKDQDAKVGSCTKLYA